MDKPPSKDQNIQQDKPWPDDSYELLELHLKTTTPADRLEWMEAMYIWAYSVGARRNPRKED